MCARAVSLSLSDMCTIAGWVSTRCLGKCRRKEVERSWPCLISCSPWLPCRYSVRASQTCEYTVLCRAKRRFLCQRTIALVVRSTLDSSVQMWIQIRCAIALCSTFLCLLKSASSVSVRYCLPTPMKIGSQFRHSSTRHVLLYATAGS